MLLELKPEVLTTKSVAPAGCELGPAPVPGLQLLGAVVAGEAEALELKTVIVRIYQRERQRTYATELTHADETQNKDLSLPNYW